MHCQAHHQSIEIINPISNDTSLLCIACYIINIINCINHTFHDAVSMQDCENDHL